MMREWTALLCAQINFGPLRAARWENRRARPCQCTSLPDCSWEYHWDVSNLHWWKHVGPKSRQFVCTHAKHTNETFNAPKRFGTLCVSGFQNQGTFLGMMKRSHTDAFWNRPLHGSLRRKRQSTGTWTHFSLVKWQRLGEYCWRRQSEYHLITTRAAV